MKFCETKIWYFIFFGFDCFPADCSSNKEGAPPDFELSRVLFLNEEKEDKRVKEETNRFSKNLKLK